MIIYGIESYVLASYTSNLVGMLFLLILYPMGLFTINYFVTYYKLRGTFNYLMLFMRKSDLIAQLKTKRQELIDELERRKVDYQKLKVS